LNRDEIESGIKLFTPFSDDFQPTQKVAEGNIVVVSGLGATITGDTLVGSKLSAKAAKSASKPAPEVDHHVNILEGIDSPDPVFFCSVEPPTSSSIHAFERALIELAIEDPSLRVRYDNETGQTILEGMGELHI
uniref:Elongation Factor G domain-containing protein n=1 Tax=Panagrolaimus sp. ES5 TaxID=591445 RepID=A0AC34GMP0_9BILA